MHRFHKVWRFAAVLSAVTLAACSGGDNNRILGPKPTGANSIFQSYVSMGNSITAGYSASGITDATQRTSYAFLLAQQMGTRFAYPSLAGRGCNPPVANFQTQAGPGTITAAQRPTICDLRTATSATDILNNVAVPNASSFDPTDADGTPFSNILTSLFLGGKTQVQRALEAHPTFASIWIGNNDVLGFALRDGRAAAPTGLAGMTPVATFQTNYTGMLNQLLAAEPDLEGILIGVGQVANLPVMFPAAAMSSPAFKAGFDAIAGTATTLDNSCVAGGAGATSLINIFLAFQIRTVGAAGGFPPIVACVAGGASGALPAPVGDILILEPSELTTLSTRIDAHNAHIAAEATRIGFAYYDPNPRLVTLRTAGTVLTNIPNLASATATFGTGMALDGVHPGAPIHRIIVNDLIPLINTKYGTTLVPVP
ncbi:MAG: SGNH/GDSL hydrolase family protein [Gemmatimonadaceae bacterium]